MGGRDDDRAFSAEAREREVARAATHLREAIDALVKAELPLASAYADFALSICLRAQQGDQSRR